MERLLPSDNPGVKRILYELKRLLLDIGKRGLFQVTYHVRRDTENPRNLVDLKFSGFQKLCLLRRNGDGRVFHAFLQDCHLAGVSGPAELTHPGIPYTLRIFDGAGVLQHTAWSCTVCKEFCTVFLRCNGESDGVLRHGNRRVSDKAVKAKPRYMQNILRHQHCGGTFHRGCIIGRCRVLVVEPPLVCAVNLHPVRHQGIEGNDLAFAVADNLRISVAPEKQMRHQRFSENKTCHFLVRFIVKQEIQRMFHRFFLAAVAAVFV